MHIQIASLSVKDCGTLRDVKIDFTDTQNVPQAITVLGGANGSGKTTLFELIFELMNLFRFSPDTIFTSLDNLNLKILGKTKYAELELIIDKVRCSVIFGQIPDEAKFHKNKHGIVCDNDGKDKMKWRMLSSGEIPQEINGFIKHTEKNSLHLPFWGTPAATLQDYSIPAVLYFPYNRELFPVKGEQIYREQGSYTFTHRYKSNSTFKGSFESYLIWLDYSDQKLFGLVKEFLNQLNFNGKIFAVNRKDLNVIVTTADQRSHRLNELSSGEQSILIMLLEIRRRIIPGSIVLIDEIENSLHPEFQQRIATGLLQLQEQIPFQLIVTTHEHEFVKIFGGEHTRLLTEF